jgi:hypothetical protein
MCLCGVLPVPPLRKFSVRVSEVHQRVCCIIDAIEDEAPKLLHRP